MLGRQEETVGVDILSSETLWENHGCDGSSCPFNVNHVRKLVVLYPWSVLPKETREGSPEKSQCRKDEEVTVGVL